MSLHFESQHPGRALRGVVAEYASFRIEGNEPVEHFVPPDAACALVVIRGLGAAPRAVLLGPRRKPFRTTEQPGVTYWSIRLCPGMAPAARIRPSDHVDRRDGLEQHQPQLARAVLGTAVQSSDLRSWAVRLDGALPHLLDRELGDPLAAAAYALLRDTSGAGRVSECWQRSSLSSRQQQRRFKAAVGLAAKEVARIERVRSALDRALHHEDATLADLAAASGFADQPHMNREYRRVTGLAPSGAHKHLRRIRHTWS